MRVHISKKFSKKQNSCVEHILENIRPYIPRWCRYLSITPLDKTDSSTLDTLAAVTPDISYCKIHVYLADDWFKDEEREHVFIHEITHAHFSPLTDFLDTLVSHLDDPESVAMKTLLDQAESWSEFAVEELSICVQNYADSHLKKDSTNARI